MTCTYWRGDADGRLRVWVWSKWWLAKVAQPHGVYLWPGRRQTIELAHAEVLAAMVGWDDVLEAYHVLGDLDHVS